METRCPICRKPVPPRDQNPAAPFCSPRCRMIDLGNWLGESYRIPVDEGEEDARRPGPGDDGGEVSPASRHTPERHDRGSDWKN
ncbi:MAG TPA: DNA gyrase inhibitor YacG [Polyangia bacterium]|nr:DNA gyrase inhibitor YacG [Polyangia bacterium]